MALEPYGIGGTEVKGDAYEAFADIPQNRVLLAEKLTYNAPVRPAVVEGLTDIGKVFEHFQPQVDMEFETEEGTARNETLTFNGLEDFGVKGITAQSDYLTELNLKQIHYQKIVKQLKSNKMLKQALENKDSKTQLLNVLKVLIQELGEAK
jgi:hypothetical protein